MHQVWAVEIQVGSAPAACPHPPIGGQILGMPQGSCWQALLLIFPLLPYTSPTWGLQGSAAEKSAGGWGGQGVGGEGSMRGLGCRGCGLHAFSKRWASRLYNYTPDNHFHNPEAAQSSCSGGLLVITLPHIHWVHALCNPCHDLLHLPLDLPLHLPRKTLLLLTDAPENLRQLL